MPDWEGLEDASAVAQPLWLARPSASASAASSSSSRQAQQSGTGASGGAIENEHQWSPLRKVDCRSLNRHEEREKKKKEFDEDGSDRAAVTNDGDDAAASDGSTRDGGVLIEGGRATAYPTTMTVKYNFFDAPDRELCRATWFHRIDPKKKGDARRRPTPLPEMDCDRCEGLYQTALRAFSSLDGSKELRDAVLKEEVPLDLGRQPQPRPQAAAATDSEGSGDDNKQKESDYEVVDGLAEITSQQQQQQQQQQQPQFVAFVSYNAATKSISIRKRPAGRLSAMLSFPELLQRGYGEYEVEGEKEEEALGPVRHLAFVVHGVGEAMWSRSDVNVRSMVEEMDHLRAAMHRRQIEIWNRRCEREKREWEKRRKEESPEGEGGGGMEVDFRPRPPRPDRIEVLPIQWFHRIHSTQEGSLKRSLNSVTLGSIPALRDIANDVVFDVLMYMTPEFCQEVLDCVTTQINDLYRKFNEVHKDFAKDGGRCSLVGHSLGSVIAWDLLSILQASQSKERKRAEAETAAAKEQAGMMKKWGPLSSLSLCGGGYELTASPHDVTSDDGGTWGPSLKREMTATIPFEPDFTVFLGSPLGLFLTLRGAHSMFETMRREEERASTKNPKGGHGDGKDGSGDGGEEDDDDDDDEKFRTSPFALPTGALYNIFNPSDPIAYRIEPLLLDPNAKPEDIPPPCILATAEGGVRAGAMMKQLGDNLKLRGPGGLFTDMLATVAGSAASLASGGKDGGSKEEKGFNFALGGRSDRVDFQLQQGIIDNQYISAVTAHQSYFGNGDILDFIIETATEKHE